MKWPATPRNTFTDTATLAAKKDSSWSTLERSRIWLACWHCVLCLRWGIYLNSKSHFLRFFGGFYCLGNGGVFGGRRWPLYSKFIKKRDLTPLWGTLLVLLAKRKNNVLHHDIGDREICMAWNLVGEKWGYWCGGHNFNFIACWDFCFPWMMTLGAK